MFNQKLKINKVIFVNLDSVLGGLLTSTVLKPKYGEVDIIHSIREYYDPENNMSDAQLLLKCQRDVISTCWDIDRTINAIKAAGLTDVRVYELGSRIDDLDDESNDA